MDSATLKALQLSIKHWQRNVKKVQLGKLKIEDINGSRCALCKLYKNFCRDNYNNICPVKIKSKADNCSKTPWIKVKAGFLYFDLRPDLLNAVKDEVKFLQSLLPASIKGGIETDSSQDLIYSLDL